MQSTNSNTTQATAKPKQSRFNFISQNSKEEGATDFIRIQDDAINRREEFRDRIRAIENQISKWSISLANEALNREQSYSDLVERSIYLPIQQSTQTIFDKVDNDLGNTEQYENMRKVERNIMDLENNLIQLKHVTVFNAKKENFDNVESSFQEGIYNEIKSESFNASKQELVVSRKLEEVASNIAKEYNQEKVSRLADIQLLSQKEGQTHEDQKRVSNFMSEVHELKSHLKKEIEERKSEDEKVLELFLDMKDRLQKNMFESIGAV